MNDIDQSLSKLHALCSNLKLASLAHHATEFEEAAKRQGLSYLQFLLELLERLYQEQQERRAKRCLKAAHFPQPKTLHSFDFSVNPDLPETLIRQLATGTFIEKAQPIIFVGEPGTGKTHLATAIGYRNASLGYKVRFITTADLVNQLMEAKDARTLSATVKRFSQYCVLIIDELGYLPLSQADAELLFQVLSKRHESKATIITTNLPFSEWSNVFKDPRLCKAVIDRITYNAHIISTGEESARFNKMLKNKTA